MKIQFRNYTLSTANRLKKKMEDAKAKGADKTNPKIYYYIFGVWDSRILGLCFYRNSDKI